MTFDRELGLLREAIEREQRLQRGVASRVVAPVDSAFDLLEETGATLERQADALAAAGRALEETAALVRHQAELYEATIGALRRPTKLAKAAAGLETGKRPAKD